MSRVGCAPAKSMPHSLACWTPSRRERARGGPWSGCTPVQARAAECRLLLDDAYLEPSCAARDGGDVAAGAGAITITSNWLATERLLGMRAATGERADPSTSLPPDSARGGLDLCSSKGQGRPGRRRPTTRGPIFAGPGRHSYGGGRTRGGASLAAQAADYTVSRTGPPAGPAATGVGHSTAPFRAARLARCVRQRVESRSPGLPHDDAPESLLIVDDDEGCVTR